MIICLNGHPLSGKSTIARRLITMNGFSEIPLNRPFRDFVMKCVGLGQDSYNLVKDRQLPYKGGIQTNVRQLMIKVADVMEEWDPAVWARMAVDGLNNSPGTRWVFDAIGKESQWKYLVDNLGENNLLLVEVVRDRLDSNHHTYSDERHNIMSRCSPANSITIHNDGSINDLYIQVDAIARKHA